MVEARQNHNPAGSAFKPKNLRVSEVLFPAGGQHRISPVFPPGSPTVVAVSQALALLAVHMLVVCKQSNKHRLLSRLQAAGVVPVYHRASRPDLTDGIRLQGRGKMLPVDKIPAHRVSPMDVIMDIVLVHQMVLAVIIQKPVWVINYMGLGGIVEQRTVRILKIRFSLQAFVTPLPLRSSVP